MARAWRARAWAASAGTASGGAVEDGEDGGGHLLGLRARVEADGASSGAFLVAGGFCSI